MFFWFHMYCSCVGRNRIKIYIIKKKWLDNDKMFLDDFQVHPEQTLKESIYKVQKADIK